MITQGEHEKNGNNNEDFEQFKVIGNREKAIARLRRLIAEGEASGEPQELDFDELLADLEA